jgi:hypothetical protein
MYEAGVEACCVFRCRSKDIFGIYKETMQARKKFFMERILMHISK